MATYYVGTPSSGNGDGSSANPWNQAGFDAATLSFGDYLIVNSGSSLTTTVNQLFASLPTSTSSTRGAELGSEGQEITAAPGTLIAYGANSSWSYRVVDATGKIALSNATFNDPLLGTGKKGYAVTSLSIGASGFSGTYNIADIAAALAVDGGALFNGATDLTATTAATVAQATTIESFTNTGANTYNISDTAANLAASTDAVLTLAGTVTASTTASASEANTLGGFSKAVVYSISDTASNVAGADATALNEAVNITATGTATVAEATAIVNATNSGTNTYNLSDTASNLAGAASDVGNGAGTITATTAATVAQATTIESFTNTGANTYNISDTAANLAASTNAVLTLAGTVTASTTASASQANTLGGFSKAVVYSISDTASNVAGATATALNEAVNITATGTATVAQATAIVNATNSGTNTYNLSDTASNLAGAASDVGNGAGTITATTAATVAQATTIESFTNTGANTYNISDTAANLAASTNAVLTLAGTVTASTAASASQANTLGGFSKAVVYSISDTAANVAGATATALNEAVNITATGTATASETVTILGAANTGTTSIAAASMTAAQAVALSFDVTGNDTISALTVSDAATVAQATALRTDQTNGDVTSLSIASLSDTAANISGISAAALSNVSGTVTATAYTNETLTNVSTQTLTVITADGAVLDAAKLATADSVTLVGINSATAADADTLGSRLTGTATLNITTDPIIVNTDLSDLGSGLTLQFGGNTTLVVNGATLSVRQDQVSGYTISGTGTVAAAGTASADSFDATNISAATNFSSFAGNDSLTIAPTTLGSEDTLDGGANTDTLIFSAATTSIVDASFTNVTNTEILQLANGTNTINLGSEAENAGAGITTVTGGTGADTVNLIYGTTGFTFNAGGGSDTLSYSADSGAQSITLLAISSGSASGTVTNNGTDTFTALEAIVGGSGSSDLITATSAAETLTLSGANAGNIDNFGFSGIESVDLGAGNDTASINTAGSLSGNLSFGMGSDTLSYATYGSAVTVSLSSATSASAATAISGTVSGFESLVGGNGSDTLNASSGANTLNVAADGTTTLDSSLTVSGFETINLGANADASADSATVSGAFSGSIDLGAGNDTATINNGGSVTSLAGGSGSDSLDLGGAANSVTITGSGAGTTAGSTGGTSTFSGFETVNALAGDDTITLNSASTSTINLDGGAGTDSLSVATSDTADNTFSLSGSGSGTLGAVTFSGIESISLGSGNDTATVTSGGSLSGTLNLGDGNNSLTFNSGAGSVGSLTAGSGNDSVTINGGSVTGAVALGDGSNSLTISSSSSTIGGNVSFGTGASDTLSYATYGSAVTVSLSSATSASAVTAISGTVSGFESLVGGNGSDTLNASSGVNSLNVAANGTTTLDSSLTVSGFETINLGANSDASADTATVSGTFSGTIDLGAGDDSATINNGGSVTSLAGGSGSDSLNLDGAANSVTITGSGAGTTAGTSGGTTTFSGFETVNALNGDDTITLNSASTSTVSLDGGNGVDTLQIATSDSSNNQLTLSSSGGGSLGGVSFTNIDNITLGSGSDTVTLASGGGLLSTQPGLLADFYTESGTGGIGSLLRSAVSIGPVNLQDADLQSIAGRQDHVYVYAYGYLTAPGSGSYNDFIVSTTSDDGIKVRLDLAGTGSYTTVINNYTTHSDTIDSSSPLSVTAGQRIPIQIEFFDSGGGATLELYYQSSSQGISRTLVPLSNLSSSASSATSGQLDLGAGNDSVSFQTGTLGVGSLSGGAGTDTLNYASYGSGVTVNLAAGSATGTSGISGFETVLGSASGDAITASTSGDVNLQGNAGNDTFSFTVAGLTNTDSVDGGSGTDTLVFSDAGTISDSQFTNVTTVESLTLSGASTLTAGSEASQAGIATVTTGSGNTTVNTSLNAYDLSIDAASLGDGASLTLTGSANTNDFTVNNLIGSVLASGTSGSLTITSGDAGDNAIGVTTGSGNTTINASGSGDTVTVNADAMADNTTLDINGSASFAVTNLEADVVALSSSGSLTLAYTDVTDNQASLVTGSGNVVVNGGNATDTITVTGLSTNNQTFNAQASTSNFNITAGANNQTITGSNTGSDTIAGGNGTDTLSYAGGSNVDVTITSYVNQAGGSTGQGTDQFTGIESLVGATGTDILRGTATATDEVATITSANSGTLRDSGTTGSFSFSSFEQIDLQGGNDTLNVTGSSGGVSLAGSVDLGSGNNTLSMSGSAGSIASLSAGSGTDIFTISAGSITGALSAGDGTNTLTISGSSSSVGSYSGGTGSDSITLSGGDVAGNVTLGDGSNTLLINNSSSTVGGNVTFGTGTSDTLSYAVYSNTVSVNLSDISGNSGTTISNGATAISGIAAGFETLVGGSTTADSITDSSGDSTIAVTGANSGTIDGLAFSSFENLNLSTGNDMVTVSGSGSGVSLTGSLDLGDGTNSLTMNGSAGSIASVSSGTGDDTMAISSGSVTGAVNAGDGTNSLTISGTSSSIGSFSSGIGSDSVTLSGGDVVGNVSTGTGSDTVLISSTTSTIGANLDLGSGNTDTLSYAGYSNDVSVTLTAISSNSGSTAAGGATAIGGTASGFENLVGGNNSADTLTDATGDSTIVISGANSGTIDGMTFSAIENLSLSTGIDGVTVTSGGSLSGNLNLGDGSSNTVVMNSGAGAIGSFTSGSGNDTITIDGGSVTGAVSTGDGNNTLTINNTNSSIGSYTGGSGVDSIVSKGGDINGNVSTGASADSLTLSDAGQISGNVTLGSNSDSSDGGDTLTVSGSSSTKAIITGSISTGAGADSVSFTDATIGGSGQTLSLGSDNNFFDGNDSLSSSNTAITATVTTGSGSDSVSLTDGSTITGDVSLGINSDTQNYTNAFDSATGWTGGIIDSGSSYYGNFLGRYASGAKTLGQDTSTTLSLGSLPATISFDVHRLDSWDGESFTAYINNTPAFQTTFRAGQAINGASGTTNGYAWTITPKDSIAGHGFSGWDDQTATVTITISAGSPTIKLGFGSGLDQGIGDESYGIDNLSFATITSSADSLSLDASSITGNVTTGSGADMVSLTSASTITGNLSLGVDGDMLDAGDSLTVSGSSSSSKSVITGSITTGAGADLVSFSDATIGGTGQILSLGSDSNSLDGSDILTATGTAITATVTTGAGADSVSLTSSSVVGDVSLGIAGDTTNGNGDTLTLDASSITGNVSTGSGADTVTLKNTSTITGDLTLGSNSDSSDGVDTLTVSGSSSSSKSVITGSIATGAGADSVSFTNATIGGTGLTLSLGTDSNSLDGNDILTATGTTITAAVSTGAGADTVSLTSSSLTGAVSMGIDGDTTNGNGDALTLDTSTITGNVSTGSGADTVTLKNTSTITGDLTLGSNSDSSDGVDTLTVSGSSSSSKSVITGSIATGAGADSVSFSDATVGGTGKTLTLGSDSNNLDGSDTLTVTGTTITAAVTTGSGSDTVTLTTSAITGAVSLGIDGDTTNGNGDVLTLDASSITGNVSTGSGADMLTLTNASTITGNVTLGSDGSTTDGNDTLNLGSGAVKITGDVSLGAGSADLITYQGHAEPVTFTVSSITADGIGTGSSAAHRAAMISGAVSGYETVIGSDASGFGLGSGDVLIDATGDSIAILSSTGAGTLGSLDFAAFESLRLASGDDVLRFEGSAAVPGALAGRTDGGGIEGATYSYGVLSGGSYQDSGTDLLDYRGYAAGGITVNLSQNLATGVYGGLAGGLIDATGAADVNETSNSSFENVYGSSVADSISGDNQANLLRGYGGGDTILGLGGNDTIDGGDNTSGADGADVIAGGDGADLILGSDGNDFISGGAYTGNAGSYSAVADQSIDTLSYADENEGLDLSLTGTDKGTLLADAGASLSVSLFTSTYDSASNLQLIAAPTNQSSTDWTDTYGDIQNLVLTSQNDIVRLDSTDVSTGSIDAGSGSLDTLDYSSFNDSSPVLVNLSGASYSFDFDSNGTIDTTAGEITIANAHSATNVMVSSASQQGGANGVSNFEVVIGGAGDDAIVGNSSDNLLVGNAGDDRIAGGAGNDTIFGGTGDDYINPGDGTDLVNAGAGINTVSITSSDLSSDTFVVDPNGINIFRLEGDGNQTSSISAPVGSWNPGAQGIDLLDGGDPVVTGSGPNAVTTYDSIDGSPGPDYYELGGAALKNIDQVNLGQGDDRLGTAATSKGIKVVYDGNDGTDSITLNLTFSQFAKLNASGLYVADVQSYLDSPAGKEFRSSQADFTTTNFESAAIAVITPAVYNALQGDPAAITLNSAYGVRNSTINSADAINLDASAITNSSARAISVPDIVSALVQANGVKGADDSIMTSGSGISGSTIANQTAAALATTVDDRADAVLSAYGLGTDRSSFTAGEDLSFNLSGTVDASTSASSAGFVVTANGTVETAGSRDTSLSAGGDAILRASGSAQQSVSASNVDGLALAGLASRTFAIDDANLSDVSSDSVQAGGDLTLTASANSTNTVVAQAVGNDALGTISLVDNGAAGTDRFTTPITGAAFPLINGDRLRFSSSNGSVQAGRDYYVINVIPISGEFQLSSQPNGDPINVVASGSLQAYRPAVATADAISTVSGVDLNRSVAGLGGVQGGGTLSLTVNASNSVDATAGSVDGDATAGLNRLGGLDNLNTSSNVSTVTGLADTVSLAGTSASLNLRASDVATLIASTNDGGALTDANARVVGSQSSPTTAGTDLGLVITSSLSLSGRSSSTSGSAIALSGAGTGESSSSVAALANGDQSAGEDLTIQAAANSNLSASATTVGGSSILGSLWTSTAGNILATFDLNLDTTTSTPSFLGPHLFADGQVVQLATPAAGLSANTDYAVRLLGFGGVDATTDRITMPTGISYANNDAVRFRLDSTTSANAGESRYGLDLGSTYYVVNVTGTTFQLSAAPGGPVIDLSPDSLGMADQLIDADRFQLLIPIPPALPVGTPSVAPLTGGVSGVSLILPAVANASAGSTHASTIAIDGNLAAQRSLTAAHDASVSATVNDRIMAMARNTNGDANAVAGSVASGVRNITIASGGDGAVRAGADVMVSADAITIGDSTLDDAVSSITVTSTGVEARRSDNDITIGGDGVVSAAATTSGRSAATGVSADTTALASVEVAGLKAADADFAISIGNVGQVIATALVGSADAPLVVVADSAGLGDAIAQASVDVGGILGTLSAGSYPQIHAGSKQSTVVADGSLQLRVTAKAVDGTATASLSDSVGSSADVFGLRDMNLALGAGRSTLEAGATTRADLLASSVEGDAYASSITRNAGILGDVTTPVSVALTANGQVAAIASQATFAESTSVQGSVASSISNSTRGIEGVTLVDGDHLDISTTAVSQLFSRATTVAGDARA